MPRFEDSDLAIGWSRTSLVMGRSSGQCDESRTVRDISLVPLNRNMG
jgi:hypothetical protein